MKVVTYLGSLVQSCCGEGGTLQTNITGVCGECLQCLGHPGFSPLTACVLSPSTLLRLQVALQGNCLRQALDYVHFPDLRCSGSGNWVLHKGADSVGPAFCALPSVWRRHSPSLAVHLITSPVPATQFPGCAAGAPSQVCPVPPLGN